MIGKTRVLGPQERPARLAPAVPNSLGLTEFDLANMRLERVIEDLGRPAKEAKRLRDEERARAAPAHRYEMQEQIEAEQKRQQEIARRKIEKNRWRRVLELSDRRHSADRLRSFVAAIEAMGTTGDSLLPGGRTHDEWLAWVKQRISAYDPLEAGAEAIWSNLGAVTSWEYND
jgi:hypothetical protein